MAPWWTGADDSPVGEVSVFLLDSDGAVRGVLSNFEGSLAFILPFDGPFRLRTERIGYTPVESSLLALDGSERLEVVIRIPEEPLPFKPITVVAPSGRLTPGRIRNAERLARGEGVFLNREEIRSRGLHDARDLLRGVEGMRTTLSARRGAIPLWDGHTIFIPQRAGVA